MLSNERITAIQALRTAITPPPWEWTGRDGYVVDRENAPIFTDLDSAETWIISSGIMRRGKVSTGCIVLRETDAAFIAAAPDIVDDLLAERAALLAQIDTLFDDLTALREELRQTTADAYHALTMKEHG